MYCFQLHDENELIPLQQEHHNIQMQDKDFEAVHLIHSEQTHQIPIIEKTQVGLFLSFKTYIEEMTRKISWNYGIQAIIYFLK